MSAGGGPRTKIVATIGPATAAPERIDELLEAGMNVARVNCAHASTSSLPGRIGLLRERSEKKGAPLAILADLGGPKLRLGTFAAGPVQLEPGAPFVLTTADVAGSAQRVSVNYHSLPDDVRPGDAIYLNDGLVRLIVRRVEGNEVYTEVDVGGAVSDMKGLNVPGAAIRTAAVTEKDWRDVGALAGTEVDYIGLSFVRSAGDVELLRRGLEERGADVPIVAKIEKAQAISNLPSIIAAADAVMVARGDLGVECPIEDTPILQKRIIRACNAAGKPVITATQMLESMTEHPRPTRAEATDVANAALDGTDAVMLSGETATGKHPVRAVRTMREILERSNRFALETTRPTRDEVGKIAVEDAAARSACLAAESLRADAIICLTQSGTTARLVASWRPRQPILAATPERRTWHQLALVWGVRPLVVPDFGRDFDQACAYVIRALRERGDLKKRQKVVLTAGLPFTKGRRANTVRIETV